MQINFVVRPSKKGKDGTSPIELSIIINNERKVVTLDRRGDSSKWNSKKQQFKADKEGLNEYIESIRKRLYSLEIILMDKGTTPTVESVYKAFKYGIVERKIGIVELAKQMVNDKTMSYDQTNKFLNVASNLEECFEGDIDVRYLTNSKCEQFYKWLITHGNCNNTAINKCKMLKRVLQRAVDERYININPYKLKLSKDKLTYTPLTIEEINKIKNKDCHCERLNNVRDIIIIACYTGLAYTDLKSLTKEDCVGNAIIKKRHKTRVSATIPLLEPAREILEKYDWKLPILSNQKMNAYCKEIQCICGISKNLHMHLFRHTFATLLINAGVDMTTVSRCCGHSNTRITESTYAQLHTSTIIDNVNAIASKLV